MRGDVLLPRSSGGQVCAVQSQRRQQEPSTRGRVAARYIGRIGIDFRKFDLSPKQALLSRGQQPFHCLPPVARDGIPVIVHAIVAQHAEIVLRTGVARLRGSQQLFLYPAGPSPWRSCGDGRSHLRGLQLEFHLAGKFRARSSVVSGIGVAASAYRYDKGIYWPNEEPVPQYPISSMTPPAIVGAPVCGLSATIASVVISSPATDAAPCSARRTTLAGSMMPASIIFT